MPFGEIDQQRRILERVRAKKLEATILFVDFTKAFDSIHSNRANTRDTDYIDIVACVLQGDTLASYPFIICLDYVLRTSIDNMKENGSQRKEAEGTWHEQLPTPMT